MFRKNVVPLRFVSIKGRQTEAIPDEKRWLKGEYIGMKENKVENVTDCKSANSTNGGG